MLAVIKGIDARFWRSMGASVSAACIAVTIGLTSAAHAFKWAACPAPPLPIYPSALGATTSPFVHPGHALTILLNQDEIARAGGFSTAPEQNVVRVTFASLFGAPLQFPDIMATAVSPSSLTFQFPDATQILGRPLAGPASVRVLVGSKQVAYIRGSELVALPPANNGNAVIELGAYPSAAVGANGDLWLPLQFTGPSMEMPGCEGPYVQPTRVLITSAHLEGLDARFSDLLSAATQIDGFLGDVTLNGVDFYGWKVPEPFRAVRGADGNFVIDRMNDTTDIVLRIRGSKPWVSASMFQIDEVIADSTPIELDIDARH